MVGVGRYAGEGWGRGWGDNDLPQLSPQQQETLLSSLSRNTGTALEQIGLLLDTPGAIARGVLAGDAGSGLNWDYDKRTSGRELLESYGVLDPKSDSFAATAAGIGAEIAVDPLAAFQFPLSALSKAGKAAKAANLLDLAPLAAQNKMGIAQAANTLTGRVTNSALEALMPQGLAKTAQNYAVRPLVGPRVARTMTTLDDVVQAAPDPTLALERVNQYLGRKGLRYDDVRNQNLGGAFGIGPFSSLMTFTPPGSKPVLDAMDALGQKIAWSYPARLASAAFDERVAGMVDAGDQMASMRQFDQLTAARGAGRRLSMEHAETVTSIPVSARAQSLLGADTLMSEQGNDFLTRVFEGKPTATDRALMRELPGIDRAVASWDRIRTNNVSEAQRLGLDFTELRDPRFGVEYSPRSGTELDFQEYGTGFGRSMYQSRVLEDMHRNAALFTPGGTVDLREASRLPMVRDLATKKGGSQYSIAQAGDEIVRYINGKHGYAAIDQAQGEAIARVMQRLNKDLPSDLPIFAGHPLNEQTRVIISQEVARANATHIYDSLADAALGSQANQIAGSGFKRLDSAIQDIGSRAGLKTGVGGLDPAVSRQLQDRIAARMGVNPAQVDLAQFSIPESLYNRLNRVQDFYSSPRVQQEVTGMMDSLTQFWKASILAFPARHVRDAYSNAVSVWLETGDPMATTWGFGLAKQVLDGKIDAVLPKILKLPQYQGLGSPQAIKTKFLSDIASTGILTGLSQADVIAARRAGELSRLMPGLNPTSRLRSFGQLIPDGSRNPLQMARDQLQIKGLTNQFETRNAVLNWSQKMSDTNDSIARLGGYLALLSKGVSPEQAVQRMHSALVNYDSLTTFERGLMRKIFPWWAYTSRIGKYVVQNLMEHPGGSVAQMVRGSNVATMPDDDTYVPQRLRQQISLRMPDPLLDYFGIERPEDTQTFLTKIDLPGMRDIQTVNPTSIQETIANLAGQTNPFLQAIASIAFDEDLYSKRQLSDSDPAVNKLYRAATGGNLSPVAKVLGSNIPGTQRLLGLGASLVDDRNPMSTNLAKTGFNAISGMGVTQVGPDWVDADARRQAQRKLGPIAKSFGIQYLDKEQLANATPEERQVAALFEMLGERQRKRNQQKSRPVITLPPVQFQQ
jgi:hypothetical protein